MKRLRYNRREFLRLGLGGTICLGISNFDVEAKMTQWDLFTKYGINAGLDRAKEVADEGADFLLIGVNKFLVPDKPEGEFEKILKLLESSPIPVLSCNSFLKGNELRSVGPEAKTDNVLRFAEIAFKRAKRAGVQRIIFGSSRSRKRPDGWSKSQADDQFISLLKRMGDLAGEAGVNVAVENLQEKECNYLTYVHEVGEIVRAVDHPHIKVLADLYHASVMKESPESFSQYVPLIEMVEIAEAEGRTVPGVNGQDFSPYFKMLRDNGYHGPIEIEGKWEINQVARAFQTIKDQSA